MEQLKQMTLEQILAITRHTQDPVSFGQQLLSYLGGELDTAIREELALREEHLKVMKREAKTLRITFDH